MAYRCRSLSQPTFSFLKSTFTKPTVNPKSAPSLRTLTARSPLTIHGSVPHLGAMQSLLPLHTAVSSARLTSCLGLDSTSSRSLSQAWALEVPYDLLNRVGEVSLLLCHGN
ncbi:protein NONRESPONDING TO OXYLIPINS 2, mitochondrial isoform X1 [Fagus crenata]